MAEEGQTCSSRHIGKIGQLQATYIVANTTVCHCKYPIQSYPNISSSPRLVILQFHPKMRLKVCSSPLTYPLPWGSVQLRCCNTCDRFLSPFVRAASRARSQWWYGKNMKSPKGLTHFSIGNMWTSKTRKKNRISVDLDLWIHNFPELWGKVRFLILFVK